MSSKVEWLEQRIDDILLAYVTTEDRRIKKKNQILQAFHDAGGVMLAEDQTLPGNPYNPDKRGYQAQIAAYNDAQQDMHRFKRVELLFEANPVST